MFQFQYLPVFNVYVYVCTYDLTKIYYFSVVNTIICCVRRQNKSVQKRKLVLALLSASSSLSKHHNLLLCLTAATVIKRVSDRICEHSIFNNLRKYIWGFEYALLFLCRSIHFCVSPSAQLTSIFEFSL